MTTQTNFINNIPDTKPVRIFLPLQATDKRYRVQCIFQKTTTPRFNLLFEPGALPVNALDTKSPCIINLDMAGKSVSLEAMIEQVVNNQVLEMIVQKTISHEQMREYFRVDYTTPIIVSSLLPEGFGTPEEHWKFSGTSIDISGSGILAIFQDKPPADKLVRIQLPIHDDQTDSVITFLALPVRISEVEENSFVVAYHYDEINDEDRDRIVGQCLITQRRLLRLKVQVKET
ncbi:MAG: PilZ domain-containing protein [Proteobacteria bacterium]|nr:PilZ domain-containing protein [Desulfocapsa sp.]MBU3944094.1 PilZ domain-containing protein [Pseudomonadota bacterium]MCG2743977.1 PilZ domain-containing protein [Desulfobacteraceae bacterium]MBU3984178.1 PilZ domain-containing protein [Pseudomonadota bacterium]MBU4029765.1 PilZ domain-containing protein [Pseudomonadota bacterium]